MAQFPRRLAEYDPTTVIFTWGGIPLPLGASSGNFIRLERSEVMWRMPVGIDGEVTRVRSNNFSGVVTFRMRQAAVNATALSTLLTLNEFTGIYGAFAGLPFLLTDVPSGATLWSSPVAFLEGWPVDEFGTTENDREWVLLCPQLIPFLGGRATAKGAANP